MAQDEIAPCPVCGAKILKSSHRCVYCLSSLIETGAGGGGRSACGRIWRDNPSLEGTRERTGVAPVSDEPIPEGRGERPLGKAAPAEADIQKPAQPVGEEGPAKIPYEETIAKPESPSTGGVVDPDVGERISEDEKPQHYHPVAWWTSSNRPEPAAEAGTLEHTTVDVGEVARTSLEAEGEAQQLGYSLKVRMEGPQETNWGAGRAEKAPPPEAIPSHLVEVVADRVEAGAEYTATLDEFGGDGVVCDQAADLRIPIARHSEMGKLRYLELRRRYLESRRTRCLLDNSLTPDTPFSSPITWGVLVASIIGGTILYNAFAEEGMSDSRKFLVGLCAAAGMLGLGLVLLSVNYLAKNPWVMPQSRSWYERQIALNEARAQHDREAVALWTAAESEWAQEEREDRARSERETEALRERLRRDQVRRQGEKEAMNNMNGHEFERHVAEVYRYQGYSAEVTPGSGDHGIDIILDGSIAVQCKRKSSPVGQAPIRDLYGTMMHGGYKKAILVTNSTFSKQAREFAEGKNLELVDGDTLAELARNVT